MDRHEDPREIKALHALVAAALHHFDADAEVSEEEVNRFFASIRPLTKEEQAAVDRISCDPKQWLKGVSRVIQASEPDLQFHASSAMHREKGEEELDTETSTEINRKREEIREKLRKKRGSK